MKIEDKSDSVVVIIGSGIIGRIASKKLTMLKIPNVLLSPDSEIRYQIENPKAGSFSKDIHFPPSGHATIWGNQHDVSFQEFWQPPMFSNLPGFPFQADEISAEIQDVGNFLGVSIKSQVLKMSSFERSIGSGKLHLKGRDKILERRFSSNLHNRVEFKFGSLHISLSSDGRTEIFYTNLSGDEKRISTKYLILAAGGLGNLQIVESMFKHNRLDVPIALGRGYANHAKSITHILKLRKYSRIGSQNPYRFKEWRRFNVFESQSNNGDLRNPRISMRFWEMRAQEYSEAIGFSTHTFRNSLDLVLRKIGFHRYLKVMVYFEIPQVSHSSLNVVNWSQEIKISHTIEESKQLTNFYSDSISALTRKFESNRNIERAKQLEVDFSSLAYQDSHHYMSTTRMSDDPKNGIVDAWGQIHGIPKAFCVGTSVLPVSAVNHPTYLAAVLCLRTINKIALEIVEGEK